MAFVAVKPLPASSFVLQRARLGFGRGRQLSVARVALPSLRLRSASVRCSAEEGENAKDEVVEKAEVAEKRDVSLEESEGVGDGPTEDFGGWTAEETEQEPASSWKAGAFDGVLLCLP